ncbi:MAG: hypothetical protein CL847_07215 [Crocinitomicaceae bacterium]|nr:hypothetical protein [Crocinitomicaceae bacterium]|tara:strand:+ start:2784 stop:3266 length:483 start_codon:yes stop_codon:yes gene_type:complete
MKTLRLSIMAFIAVATITSCTKNDRFENTLHNCECGTMTVNDRDISIRMAEGFVPDSTNANFWRYHVVADFRTEEEAINHTPSEDLSITIELVHSGNTAFGNAVDLLTANYIEIPVGVMWEVSGGTVSVNAGDSIHNLTISNVVVDGNRTLNGELTIVTE